MLSRCFFRWFREHFSYWINRARSQQKKGKISSFTNAGLAEIVGESLGKPTAEKNVIPPEDLWEGLSNSVLLIASANHDLNMRCQDFFQSRP